MTPAATTTNGKILVVDDHVDLAENLAEILASSGYEAVTAASAELALSRLTTGDIIGLITDYRLPGLNGAQLIAEIRERGSPIPAVVMSAFADDETVGQARAAGVLQLDKPVNIERLLGWVAEALGRGTTASTRR